MDQNKPGSSVAILLLNYNQWAMTMECVESILKSDYNNFKIFLIDNGSFTNNDYDQLKSLESSMCSVIRIDKNRGYVGGMNYGLELSSKEGFDFFLIMNNDSVIAPDAISDLVDCALRHNNNCIVTGKVYHYEQPDLIQHIGYKFTNKKYLKMKRIVSDLPDNGQWDQEMEMDMIDDIFWLLPAPVYEKVGGYSPYFWFNAEQADLALRAVKAGNKLIYTPKAKLWHKGSLSIGGRLNNPKLIFYNTQATLIFKYLHMPWYRFVFTFLATIIRIIRNYLKAIIKYLLYNRNEFIGVKADYLAICYFSKWIWNKQPNQGTTPFDQVV
jgi:GT2 family glycosyltransferase